MDPIYRQNILDHYQRPRYRGELEGADACASDANPLCGDEMVLAFQVDRARGRIVKCRFTGHGCSISLAAADILCAWLEGKTLAELAAMDKEEMLSLLGIPLGPVRVKCGLLAFKVAKMALVRYAKGEEDDDLEVQGS